MVRKGTPLCPSRSGRIPQLTEQIPTSGTLEKRETRPRGRVLGDNPRTLPFSLTFESKV